MNFGLTCSKFLMKLLSDFIVKIRTLEISNMNFRASLILGLIDLATGKYFIKNIFSIKMEISIFEISNVPNFNKF